MNQRVCLFEMEMEVRTAIRDPSGLYNNHVRLCASSLRFVRHERQSERFLVGGGQRCVTAWSPLVHSLQ